MISHRTAAGAGAATAIAHKQRLHTADE